MGDYATRRLQAIDACEKVINGIEDGEITTSSALLLCKKIARLVNDVEGQEWLSYEYGGYPTTKEGYITSEAWKLAVCHGRSFYNKDKEQRIFTELAAELEETIISARVALGNYTTQGFSAAGEMAKKIFEEYQEDVSLYFSNLSTTTLQKLSAIDDMMEDGNPERYSQVLTSCRRLWEDTAKQLFTELLPDYKEKTFKTKSGKEIDISGDHYNNKLSAVVETLQGKAAKNTLVGSDIIYLIDWMEQINNLQSSGVHSDVTRNQAMQCIIHTYIALGDILKLKDNVK